MLLAKSTGSYFSSRLYIKTGLKGQLRLIRLENRQIRIENKLQFQSVDSHIDKLWKF